MKKFSSDYYSPMLSKKIIRGLVVGTHFSIAVACKPALYIPNQNNISSEVNILDLQTGRNLYIDKCGSCHALVLPEKHSPEQWSSLVDRMEKKSKITPDEKKLILAYLSKGMK